MSIQSEITRISGAKSDIADAIGNKGVTVPSGSKIDDMAPLILQIQPDLVAITGVNPTESSQTITAGSSYDGLSSVQINAISSTYVGSGIDRNDSTDLSASGATVTAPAGYYAEDATKTIASGSATTPATYITATPTIAISLTGRITSTASKQTSVTPTVSAGYVSSGTAGTIYVSGSNALQLTTVGPTTYTPGTSDQTIAYDTYLIGTQTIKGDSNLVAANIKDGVTLFTISGTFTDASTVSSGQTAAGAAQIYSGYSAWVDGAEVQGTATIPVAMTSQEILAAVQAGWNGTT